LRRRKSKKYSPHGTEPQSQKGAEQLPSPATPVGKGKPGEPHWSWYLVEHSGGEWLLSQGLLRYAVLLGA